MIEPLNCPGLETTVPSSVERRLIWVPIVGWAFAGAMLKDRKRPLIREIKAQLRSRPDTSELWQLAFSDPRDREVATRVRMILREEFGFPNNHFIPDDRVWLIFSATDDGTDSAIASLRLQQNFKFSLGKSVTADEQRRLSLGELVKRIARGATL